MYICIRYWGLFPIHSGKHDHTFPGIWGDTLVYSGIPALILLVLFLHPLVAPWGSRIKLTAKKPFIGLFLPKNSIDE
jgi:hypothetical protein